MADTNSSKKPNSSGYLKRLGARILCEANDLKRTPEALAKDLDLDFSIIQSVLDGGADEETARAVLFRMAECYPVSLSDLWVDRDDTGGGAVVMKASRSESSSRVFERPDTGGGSAPYYEYRDTAMSRLAPFKPEWIRELRVVGDADPANPGVVFNKGHLAHQQTFFIGPVNFYWEIDGQRFCAEMETGDSNYITPFVPHSFASRDADEMAVIIAVTYSGQVHQSLQDFSRIGAAAADAAAGSGLQDGFASRLRRHLAAESLLPGQFAEMLTDAGLSAARAGALTGGEAVPGPDELSLMAGVLNVRDEDLMVSPPEPGDQVIVRRHGEATVRQFPAGNEPRYRLRELARSRNQPYLKGFEVTVLSEAVKTGGEGDFRHGLHEYVYNYGTEAVIMTWGADGREAVLEPGDSAYIQPFVAHGFEAAGGDGNLVMVRIPGNLTDALFDEYASFPASGRLRVAGETEVWF
jgi:methylphosphonate synthase